MKKVGKVECYQVRAGGTSIPEHGIAVIKGVCPMEKHHVEFLLLKRERTESKLK